MLSFYLGYFFLSYDPIIFDSTIYKIDVATPEVQELTLNEDIIDYTIDDYLYALTRRYLYKIESNSFTMIDRVPLPERFNYLTLGISDIILITTEEIITVDKTNLSFKSGIGIEPGDYRPMLAPLMLKSLNKDNLIYLITDTEKNSILKVFDITTGRLIKKLTVPRILSYESALDVDKKKNTLITLNINNYINIYDLNLKKKGQIKLKFIAETFGRQGTDYIIYNQQGIFRTDRNGILYDFQPILHTENYIQGDYLFLTKSALVYIDSLTFRVKWLQPNPRITKLTPFNHRYTIGKGIEEDELYLIDIDSRQIKPLVIKKVSPREILPSASSGDSLWYLQFGAFSNYENAKTLYFDIQKLGVPVFVDSSNLYRIKVGGFVDKPSAIEFNQRLNVKAWFVFQKKIKIKGAEEFFIAGETYVISDGIIKKE